MELNQRKPNRIPEYDYNQNGAYFVTICTQDRKRILSRIIVGDGAHDVPKIALTQMGEIAQKYILAYLKFLQKGFGQMRLLQKHLHCIQMPLLFFSATLIHPIHHMTMDCI